MRIRRAEVNWGDGKVELDCRGSGGSLLPVIGLAGPTGSGKTMLMESVLRLFRSSSRDGLCFLDWDKVSATVEFDIGSGITTGAIKNGSVVQRPIYPDMDLFKSKLSGGILVYSTSRGDYPFNGTRSNTERLITPILHDLYKGEISNSVIWVDEFDMGLDDLCSQEFLNVLIKKSLERDNQLIVSSSRISLLQGVGSDNLRILKQRDTNFIQSIIKGLK